MFNSAIKSYHEDILQLAVTKLISSHMDHHNVYGIYTTAVVGDVTVVHVLHLHNISSLLTRGCAILHKITGPC